MPNQDQFHRRKSLFLVENKGRIGLAMPNCKSPVTFDTGLLQPRELRLEFHVHSHAPLQIDGSFSDILEIPPGSSRQVVVQAVMHQLLGEPELSLTVDAQTPGIRVQAEGVTTGIKDRLRTTNLKCTCIVSCPTMELLGSDTHRVRSEIVQARAGEFEFVRVIRWRPRLSITASPQAVFLRDQHSQPRDVKLQVTADSLSFEILSFAVNDESVAVDVSRGDSASVHTVKIEYVGMPMRAGTSKRVEVVIETDHATDPKIVIPVHILGSSQ